MNEKNISSNINVDPDSLRIGMRENIIQLEFGTEDDNEKFITLAEIRLNPKALKNIIAELFIAGIEYEKNTDTILDFRI